MIDDSRIIVRVVALNGVIVGVDVVQDVVVNSCSCPSAYSIFRDAGREPDVANNVASNYVIRI